MTTTIDRTPSSGMHWCCQACLAEGDGQGPKACPECHQDEVCTFDPASQQPDTETEECFTKDHDRCGGYCNDGELCECECHDIRAREYAEQCRS